MRKVLYILGQLTDQDVDWLASYGKKVVLPAGHKIIEEGQVVTDLTIILEGKAGVYIKRETMEVAKLGQGEIIGEISLIDSRPASASVICKEEITGLCVSHEALLSQFDKDIGFSARFYKAISTFLADRMRSTVVQLGVGEDKDADLFSLEDEQDLDETVMDNLHLSGARFLQIIQRLS